ncbi:VOC family protein [Halobacillus litoralis]|uniref:VOC family protein n=1 Tax=Halobacillus litoralis TaxID=45668 RepID=A0A410MI16_9BACI|nr:VOC family protein [Halobacillus litoralis]QAS54306.1 VOC family protein [Halobacillus litoralis]
MQTTVVRVGTIYIPVQDVQRAVDWYENHLGASTNYQDHDKAIIDVANLSLFLVKAEQKQSANFIDCYGRERFSLTFEVDGEEDLRSLHSELRDKGVQTSEVEDRGHPGVNFVFQDADGNLFDVWSELSPAY